MEIENTVKKLFSAQDGVINMKCRAVIVEQKQISPAQPFTRKYALSEWICQNYLRVRLTRVISGCAVGGERSYHCASLFSSLRSFMSNSHINLKVRVMLW